MAARLIINADDFGLTRGINRAIAELHQAGALTSATLMASGLCVRRCRCHCRANPGLGVGCHVVLTDGVPTAPLDQIPSLLGSDGTSFRADLSSFLFDLARGRFVKKRYLSKRLHQIQQAPGCGHRVTHVDTHKHTHIWPPVARAVVRAAHAAKVPAIRNPFEPVWSLSLGNSKMMRRIQVRADASPAATLPCAARDPRRLGPHNGRDNRNLCDRQPERGDTAELCSDAMPEGLWELVCHPGYNDADLDLIKTRLRAHREMEYTALLIEISLLATQPNCPRTHPLLSVG